MGGYFFDFQAHFWCPDITMLGRSPIKWRQHPDMTIAVAIQLATAMVMSGCCLHLTTSHSNKHHILKSALNNQ